LTHVYPPSSELRPSASEFGSTPAGPVSIVPDTPLAFDAPAMMLLTSGERRLAALIAISD
jgi:hypothetical protein